MIWFLGFLLIILSFLLFLYHNSMESFCDTSCDCDDITAKMKAFCKQHIIDLEACQYSLEQFPNRCDNEKQQTKREQDMALLEITQQMLKNKAEHKEMEDNIVECEELNTYIDQQNIVLQESNDKLRIIESDLKIKLASFSSCN